MNKFLYAVFYIGALSFLSACDDDDNTITHTTTDTPETISATTIEANRFVYEIMSDYYLWYNEMPEDLDYTKQSDTEEYFYSLLYKGDQFSFITDDADSYLKSEEGISTDKGWDYTFMLYQSGSEQVVSVVNYVYANTPAAKAGAKRGDIIVTVDGTKMTTSNYSVFGNETATYGAKRYNAETDAYDDVTYTITATEIEVSPVAEHAVFETKDGKKVGYLLYMDYYSEFNDELTDVLGGFKNDGVTELILDLRYNHGGEMTAMTHLCSLIAPAANVANSDMLVWYKFNDKLQKNYSYSKESTSSNFEAELAANSLNLSRLVVLTGSSTYSASEATILSLKPYMEVYTIGYTTGGKNTSMFVITPDMITNSRTGAAYYNSSINNWLIAPIVAQYYNSENETFDTTDGDGMAPDYEFNEYGVSDMGTLGTDTEPLTALAIEYITNNSITTDNKKSVSVAPEIVAHSNRIGGAIMEFKH